MQISHWKIGTRLGLAFGLLIVMMLGMVVVGLLRFSGACPNFCVNGTDFN